MTERAGYRRGWPALVSALALVVCAFSGLGAGALTRSLTSESTGTGRTFTVTTSPAKPTNTAPVPSATPAPTSTVAVTADFTLTVAVTPNQVGPGQRFTVVATVVGRDGATRMQGLQCSMRAPTDGEAPLFAQWPMPVVTDADGLATWSLLAPQVSPGRYAVEVIAYGQHQYSYWGDALVTLIAGSSGG